MAKFNIVGNGYAISEVDEYIDALTVKYEKKLAESRDNILALKNENAVLESSLADSKLREDEMSRALVFAVEKSQQIEKGSKKIYDLESRRMRLVYQKWRELLDMLGAKVVEDDKIAYFLKEFNEDIDKILAQTHEFESRHTEDNSVRDNLKENSSNYIKNLLNRMDYITEDSTEKQSKAKESYKKKSAKEEKNSNDHTMKENARLLNINRRFNNIYSKLGIATGSEILDDNVSNDNAYYRNITGTKEEEDQFDLDAVLTPKEDLEEIMKAFEEL